MSRIKKNDNVMVIAGKDKGKTGKVLKILAKSDKAIVENINVVKKAQRKTQQTPQGGFLEIEAPIHLSNIMLVDKKSNQRTRIAVKTQKDGSKTRVTTKSKGAV